MMSTFNTYDNLTVGSLVNISFSQEGYVESLEKRGDLISKIPVPYRIDSIEVYDGNIIGVHNRMNNYITITNYNKWDRMVHADALYEVRTSIGAAGYFLGLRVSGKVYLSDSSVLSGADQRWVIIRFGFIGNIISSCVFNLVNTVKLSYDHDTDNVYLSGVNNAPIILNKATIIDRTDNYSYLIILSSIFNIVRVISFNGLTYGNFSVNGPDLIYTRGNNLVYVSNDVIMFEKPADPTLAVSFYNGLIYHLTVMSKMVIYDQNGLITNSIQYDASNAVQIRLERNDVFFLTPTQIIQYETDTPTPVWTKDISNTALLLASHQEDVVVVDGLGVNFFVRNYPRLIGVVSQLIPISLNKPGKTPNFCPYGYTTVPNTEVATVCGGFSGNTAGNCPPGNLCYKDLTLLPLVTQVKVDFTTTDVLGPLISGEQYYIDTNGKITRDKLTNRLLGTALSNTRMLLHN